MREDARFQIRAGGLDYAHVNKVRRAMEAKGDLEAVKVAKVGKALYLVDGFHRLAAARALGQPDIAADVAPMSKSEAELYAVVVANAAHGKARTREDRSKAFRRFVELGGHKDANGVTRSTRAISAQFGGTPSHETVRKWLKALNIPMDEGIEYGGHYKPRDDDDGDDGDDDEWSAGGPEAPVDPLGTERHREAQGHVEGLRGLWGTLNEYYQRPLLEGLKELVGQMERGEAVGTDRWPVAGRLDI